MVRRFWSSSLPGEVSIGRKKEKRLTKGPKTDGGAKFKPWKKVKAFRKTPWLTEGIKCFTDKKVTYKRKSIGRVSGV